MKYILSEKQNKQNVLEKKNGQSTIKNNFRMKEMAVVMQFEILTQVMN